MNLDDILSTAATDIARTARRGPDPGVVVAAGRRRRHLMRGALVAGPLLVVVALAAIGLGLQRQSNAGPVSAASVELLDELATVAGTQPVVALEPDQSVTFTVQAVNANALPHTLDVRAPGSAHTEVYPDGSGRTDSALGSATARESFPSAGGPLYTVDPSLVLGLNAGTTTVADALDVLGNTDPETTVSSAGRLLAQPGLAASQRAAIFELLTRTAGVSAARDDAWVSVHAGSSLVAFDTSNSAVVLLGNRSATWVILTSAATNGGN